MRQGTFNRIEEEIKEDVEYFEKWIVHRRKFFKKLGWVVGIIAVLLIFSHYYLRISGVGV